MQSRRSQGFVYLLALSLAATACTGGKGDPGQNGQNGQDGQNGQNGTSAPTTGTIAGTVRDTSGAPVGGAAISTTPASSSATTAADGTFTLSDVKIGSYSVNAGAAGFESFTLANVGVAAEITTNVSLALTPETVVTGAISGVVTDDKEPTATPLAGVVVAVEGGAQMATTGSDGSFTLTDIPAGPVFLSATAPSTAYLDTETRSALFVQAGQVVDNVSLILSARPSDAAHYVGMQPIGTIGCATCHAAAADVMRSSAHNRSLARIARDSDGHASTGAFAVMLNPNLTASRAVMIPLGGTITVAAGSPIVTGVSTLFSTGTACGSTPPSPSSACALQAGDELAYTPVGLGYTKLGVVASVDSDTQVTLTANATFAPGVTSLGSATKYGVKRLSRTGYGKMLPMDANDIVAPAWPGVKATNPNYDANDPCIYNNAPTGTTCAAGGTTKYADGQVNVYWCNLKDGVNYVNDEYVQKFGGNPYSCADGAFYDGITTPAVPMVHIDVVYGGQGDVDLSGAPHKNMGVFKQRFQGRLADVKAADSWSYTAGKSLDSLTLPIQILESGSKVNGGYKMNGYHPTEQKFPGESWTQRTRTFSHGCAGCHNTGLTIDWDMVTIYPPFGEDGLPPGSLTFAAIKTYSYKDENLTCEHCHGPGSEHAFGGGGRGNKIINPKYLTAEAERQLCGKCHGYDDATNAQPAQDYGFEFPWNSDHAAEVGGGDYVPGVYDVADFFDNWDERAVDDEAFWDPVSTGGRLYGQAHRQQYTMLAQSTHANNPYFKATCTSCHDPHATYLGSTSVESGTSDRFAFTQVDYRNDVSCLSCHAEGGPMAMMPRSGPWAGVSKDEVAVIHAAAGGTVTKNDSPVVPTAEEVLEARAAVASAVGAHMYDKTGMVAVYDPTNEAMPVGRCTSCHMPKIAKSGGYITGNDVSNNQALVEGDQASHTFDVVWPWQSNALSRGGPTFQSGYYGQMISPSNVKYDLFGFMPNSCSSCHANARRASIACPDTSTIWPAYWPFTEFPTDPYWMGCYTTSAAP